MSNSVIKIENISKLYRLGEVGTGTLVHDLNRWWAIARGYEDPYRKLGRKNVRTASDNTDYVWALRNIDFGINQGEIVGFIGSNGAGKSTLLKLVSRITTPTEGTIKINGRMTSLLEIGTGMHPDMTARENIYMNGAILGMKRREITERFDDIIDFSGCSLYVDTPIKRFSSGMRVRLGFAVAAFLRSELLIVDEVLAVGDAEFQQRAVGKIGDLSREGGRTVLFVSHNMETVEHLCTRVIVLSEGLVVFDGSTEEAIQSYTASVMSRFDGGFDYSESRKGAGDLRVTGIEIHNADSDNEYIPIGAGLKFTISYESSKKLDDVRVIIGIKDMFTVRITRLDTKISGDNLKIDNGDGKIVCLTEKVNIKPGRYFINVTVKSGDILQDELYNVKMFEISPSNYFGTGKLFESDIQVKILVRHDWQIIN